MTPDLFLLMIAAGAIALFGVTRLLVGRTVEGILCTIITWLIFCYTLTI